QIQAPRPMASEILASVRTSLQQQFTAFERDCEERLQDLLASPIGTIWAEVDDWIDSIGEMQEVHRARSIVFRVSESAKEHLLESLRTRLRQQVESDLYALELLRAKIDKLVEDRLQGGEIDPFPVCLGLPPNQKLDRLLKTVVVFQREHES